jgi:hypothetical protein
VSTDQQLRDREVVVAPRFTSEEAPDPQAVIKEARRRHRRRVMCIGAGVMAVALVTGIAVRLSQGPNGSGPASRITQVSPPATSYPVPAKAKTGVISGSIYLGRSPGKVIAIPGGSVTFRSQSGELVTAKATPTGLFEIKVPPGTWTASSVAPSVFAQFCATPTSMHVVSAHVETVDVQVACGSTVGGGRFIYRQR